MAIIDDDDDDNNNNGYYIRRVYHITNSSWNSVFKKQKKTMNEQN